MIFVSNSGMPCKRLDGAVVHERPAAIDQQAIGGEIAIPVMLPVLTKLDPEWMSIVR